MKIVTIRQNQAMPTEVQMCPDCGTPMKLTYQKKLQRYAEVPLRDEDKRVLELRRIQARCPNCGKRRMVPAQEVHKNTKMTAFMAAWANLFIHNPYGMTNAEIADQTTLSERTIRRMKKRV